MIRRRWLTALALVAAAALFLLTPSGRALSESVREVFILNWPAVQKIEGTVAIEGPVRLSQAVVFEDITVPPVLPTETTRLVDGGVLTTDGFPQVVLSLHGIVRGEVVKTGAVGAILIPDEQEIRQAFDEQGLMPFAMEAVAHNISSRTAYFFSDQPTFSVSFPAYRVLLYNTTDKTVTAELHAYLTN
jgi:hypothetical protein